MGGTIVAGLGVLGSWVGARLLGKAAFKKATDEGWASLTTKLQEERTTLDKMVHDLRDELAEERIATAAERAQLRGEIITLTQICLSMESALRDAGLPVPERRYPPAATHTMVQATIRP